MVVEEENQTRARSCGSPQASSLQPQGMLPWGAFQWSEVAAGAEARQLVGLLVGLLTQKRTEESDTDRATSDYRPGHPPLQIVCDHRLPAGFPGADGRSRIASLEELCRQRRCGSAHPRGHSQTPSQTIEDIIAVIPD